MPFDPGGNYGATPVPAAPGQGTPAVTADPSTDPSILSVTKTGQKYYGTAVPGSAPMTEGLAGGDIPTTTFGAPKTLGQMKSDLYDLGVSDANAVADLQQQLIKAGLLDPRARNFSLGSVSPDDPTDKAYSRLLLEAIDTGQDYNVILSSLGSNKNNTRGQRNFQIFQSLQQQAQQQATGGGILKSSSFSLTDPNHARDLLKNALESRLGRDPDQGEISQFISTLHSSEQANPSRSSESFGGNGMPKSSVTTSSPADPTAAADAFATSTQARANEAGQQSEIGFMQVLSHLLGVNAQGG